MQLSSAMKEKKKGDVIRRRIFGRSWMGTGMFLSELNTGLGYGRFSLLISRDLILMVLCTIVTSRQTPLLKSVLGGSSHLPMALSRP